MTLRNVTNNRISELFMGQKPVKTAAKTEEAVTIPLTDNKEKNIDKNANDLYSNYVKGGLKINAPSFTLAEELLTPENAAKINADLKHYVPTAEMAARITEDSIRQYNNLIA